MLAFLIIIVCSGFMKREIEKSPLPKLRIPTDFMGAPRLHPFSGKLQSNESGQTPIFIQQVTSRAASSVSDCSQQWLVPRCDNPGQDSNAAAPPSVNENSFNK